MPYATEADIVTDIAPQFLLEALDDNNDGVADAGLLDAILQAATDDVDALIAARFDHFDGEPPKLCKSACKVFTLEKLYNRRGHATEEDNPWKALGNEYRKMLRAVGNGDGELAVQARPSSKSVLVSERSRLSL